MIAPLCFQRDLVAGLNGKWRGMRAGGKNRGIGLDPAACSNVSIATSRSPSTAKPLASALTRRPPVGGHRRRSGFLNAIRVDGVAIVRDVFPEFCVWRKIRIKCAKLSLVELLPGDAVLAPESPTARIRHQTFPGAIDDEDAIAPDEILCSGIFDQRQQSVEARGNQRSEGMCLLPDFLGRSGQLRRTSQG